MKGRANVLIREFIAKFLDVEWKWCIDSKLYDREEDLPENLANSKVGLWSIDMLNHTIYITVENNAYESETIITLSTGHISEETTNILDNDELNGINVYKKGEYGWIIYILDEKQEGSLKELPEDLKEVIRFARDKKSKMICLDRDAELVNDLPVFNW